MFEQKAIKQDEQETNGELFTRGYLPCNDYWLSEGGMNYYEYEQQNGDVHNQITFYDKLAMQSWTQDFEGGRFWKRSTI